MLLKGNPGKYHNIASSDIDCTKQGSLRIHIALNGSCHYLPWHIHLLLIQPLSTLGVLTLIYTEHRLDGKYEGKRRISSVAPFTNMV